MMQHVNSVFVAKAIGKTADKNELAVGSVFIEAEAHDGTRSILATAADAAGKKSLTFGIVEGKETVYDEAGLAKTISLVHYSKPLQKKALSSVVYSAYSAPVEDSVKITFGSSFAVEVGHRYVVRISRTDIEEHPGIQTYSYDHVATTTSLTDLIAVFVTKINKDARPGVVATSTASSITITAKAKDDNDTIPSLVLYSQVTLEVSIFKTIPTGLLTNAPIALADVTVEKTFGTPGKGNWKIVRDREDYALAYRGILYRSNGIWPYVAPELKVEKNATYDTISIEYDNDYRSADNQYIKNTPLAVEVYVKVAEDNANKFIADAVEYFAGIQTVTETEEEA